jgi:hypothetical protein
MSQKNLLQLYLGKCSCGAVPTTFFEVFMGKKIKNEAKKIREFKRMYLTFPGRSANEWSLCFGVSDNIIRKWLNVTSKSRSFKNGIQ